MRHKIAQFIEKNSLLPIGGKVIVALSGGADSVALLTILHSLGYRCSAVHCNFNLRGEESMRDENFVRNLCQRLGTALKVVNFDTLEYAREKKISIEMAARELRYNLFEEERLEQQADAVAVAHHRDDCAETLLLNLIRGTGIRGLHGIRPRNGHIVRPMLCVGRKEIINFLKSIGETYVTDSSNLTTDYTRNKIRLELLPLMQEINPSIHQTLYETALRLSQTESIYNASIKESTSKVLKNNRISVCKLLQEPSPNALLHEILAPMGFNGAQCEDIIESLDKESGRIFKSGSHTLVKDREELIIEQNSTHGQVELTLPNDGTVTIEGYGTLTIETTLFDGKISRSRNCASIDAEHITLPLTLRNVRNGDRFAPFGMRGKKLVSDYLTDAKRSIIEKQRQLVVTDSSGAIVWLVNERPAAPCCVTEKTKKILRLTWQRIE